MKKFIIIFAVILIALFVGFSVLGTRGNYTVEKDVWKLYQEHLDIAKDPNVIPDQKFEDVTAEYERIIKKYPDSPLIPGLHVRLGEVYLLKKDYGGARKVFNDAIAKYSDNTVLAAEATFKIGKSYEIAGDWANASRTYTGIITQYPETETALGVPVYIAGYYRNLNDFNKTMGAYEIAVNYYTRTAEDYAGKRFGLSALRFLSNCYIEQNRWKDSINTLGRALEEYAASGFLAAKDIDMTVKSINVMAAYQLKDYDAAVSLYQGIIDRNPNLPLSSYLQKMIDAFNELKEDGVEATDLN